MALRACWGQAKARVRSHAGLKNTSSAPRGFAATDFPTCPPASDTHSPHSPAPIHPACVCGEEARAWRGGRAR
eukprot:2932410-Rhodomonas_salina.1